MSRVSRLAAVAVVCLGFIGRAAAVAPEIKDEAKYFSADAVKNANEIIRAIAAKSGQDLLIETFAAAPGDEAELEKVRKMSAEEKLAFFGKWAAKRVEAAVVRGVYILICKDPTFFKIELGKKAQTVFDARGVARLQKIILDRFKEKQFDEGLLAGAKYVQESFAAGKALVVPEVRDDGKFFSADGIKKANEISAEIAGKYHKDAIVETYPGVAKDDVEKVAGMAGREKFDYYHKWAQKRIETLKMNGIYILVTKSPTYFKIEVTQNARSVFDGKMVAKLQKVILDEFRDQRYDEGLLAGAKLIRETLAGGKSD